MNLPERVFVTGTDTDVGKTVVSAMLTIGMDAYYWKPVQSGTIDGTDTEWIKRLSGLPDSRFLSEVYKLEKALSPHAAAAIAGEAIELARLRLPEVSPLVVEGAGGIMVPLNDQDFVIDLMKQLALPVVVVARSALGTINHTVLTVDRLRLFGLDVAGVIMNGHPNPSNRAAIEKYANTRVIAELPFMESISKSQLQEVFDRSWGALRA